MNSMSRRPLSAFALGIGLATFSAAAQAQFLVTGTDGTCPAGYVLASASEVRASQQTACSVLGTWYIARLAGGGSMDGPGYNCKIRDTDTRPLGNSLCRPAGAQYSDAAACLVATLVPSLNAQTNVGAWQEGGQTVAEYRNFSSLAGGFANAQFAATAAKEFCNVRGYDWSLPQVRAHESVPHLDVQCCSRLTQQNSSVPENISHFIDGMTADPALVDSVAESEGLDDVYEAAKDHGYDVTLGQLEALSERAQVAKRSLPTCGGLGQPGCAECTASTTVYFPFNFCCIPMKTTCVSYSPVTHCDPGLAPDDRGRCAINRATWTNVPIDTTRKGPNCGNAGQKSCWQVDDEDRDHLATRTETLNYVTVLNESNTTLPSGTRFIYVYRIADNSIVMRNYDRDSSDKQYMFPGNCRGQTDFGVYACTTSSGQSGRYLHVRHSQLNRVPSGFIGDDNWDPVWCAGEMRIENGKVCLINNESGHFKPPEACTHRVEQTLRAWGLPTESWMLTGDFRRHTASLSCVSQKHDEL